MKSNRGIVDSIFRHYPSFYLNHTSFVLALKKLIYMQSDKLLFLNSSDFFFKLIINS